MGHHLPICPSCGGIDDGKCCMGSASSESISSHFEISWRFKLILLLVIFMVIWAGYGFYNLAERQSKCQHVFEPSYFGTERCSSCNLYNLYRRTSR